MRLGICTFGGDGGKSGISRYIINVLQQLEQQLGSDEAGVVVYPSEEQIFLPAGARRLQALHQSERLRSPVRNILWHQTALPGLCRRERFGVMFLPAANRRLSLRLPCPMVGTVHDFSSLHVAAKYDPARMFYIRKVLPFLIRRLDHVLTVSESSRRDIIDYAGVPGDRVTVTPLAADHTTYFPGDQDEARRLIASRYGIERPYILYTSRLEHPGKNHVRLIQAFDRMKKATGSPHQLVLAGAEWSGSEAVHEAAAKSPYSADIVFPGFVPGGDLPALYRAAEVFMFPSLFEGFGLPIIEAMACGTPTACSNLSSMPEVAGNAAPTFDPYQVEQIEAVLTRLLTDAAWRDECRQKGIVRASQFNWARTAQTTLAVLRATAQQRSS
jgi:glycosyltransferase involved in cell wall biosynthesis